MNKVLGGNEKITEALKLLDEAAKEKKDELRELIAEKYENLKEATGRARELSIEKTKELASTVDESVHENPWYYIGGVAIGALLLGYILGRKD